ncbi:uncharacterized protein METZ01_LOCUS421461 [marine metagenome]|uniref:Uncharacterized protein n=1 Tax=marine metagenome TaxID=408172 RepID=A0A382XBQ4_9ZZZZ
MAIAHGSLPILRWSVERYVVLSSYAKRVAQTLA